MALTWVMASTSASVRSSSGSSDLARVSGDMRPGRVGVGVVALPADRVDADPVAALEAGRVVDEAGDDALAEHLARQHVAEVLARSTGGGAGRSSRRARGSRGSSRCRLRTARTAASGNLRSTGDQSRSAAACTMFIGCRLMSTSIGASTEVMTRVDDEPMCMHTIVPSSLHADQNGSQWSLCRLGSFSFSGFSENDDGVTALRRRRGGSRRP